MRLRSARAILPSLRTSQQRIRASRSVVRRSRCIRRRPSGSVRHFPVNACRRLQHLQRPTSSHFSPNAPRASRRGDGHMADRRRSSLTILEPPTLRARPHGNVTIPACLIADVHMPMMTGLEPHRRLFDMGHAIPTILVPRKDWTNFIGSRSSGRAARTCQARTNPATAPESAAQGVRP